MARRRRSTGRLEPHPLVKRLAAGGSQPPRFIVLAGLPGTSSRGGWRRLYLRLDAREYVEFRDSDVRHEERVSSAPLPDEQVVVWLAQTATTVRGRADSRETQTEFLRGRITATQLAGTAFALRSLGGVVAAHTASSCYHQCPSGFTACGPVLCTLPGFGCATSQSPDICV
jgi:hypothetical protein